MQTKRNRKVFALISIQTENKNEKYEATLLPCLNKALLCKEEKAREGKGKQNITISPG